MKRFFLSAALFAAISSSAFAFSEKDIISPASGIWCNQQALVLNPCSASEIYYSISGSDPFESGFAYDGPVLIERKGDVCVRVGVVEADGGRKEYVVDYTVMSAELSNFDGELAEYIEKNLVKSPLITYRCGNELSLPSGLRCSFEKNRFAPAKQKLMLNSNNSVERFVSFFVSDGVNNYHSVIRVLPAEKTVVAGNGEVPFTLHDWTCFSFNDKRYIYQIDDEMWNSDYSERTIDRDNEHVVRWQSVNFSEDSSVNECVLPPVPSVESVNSGEGVVAFEIEGDGRYTFENGERKIYAEAFYGEETESAFAPKIYLDGILNGALRVSYELDRLPPAEPVFAASGNATFSRKTVALKINLSEEADVYYAVSEPYYYEEGNEIVSSPDIKVPSAFIKNDGNDIIIENHEDRSCAYRVYAYSVDKSGNKSRTVEQEYIIDEYNLYLDGTSTAANGDGSFMNPFASLDQAVASINSSEGETRLHLKGDLTVNAGEHVITKNCVIHGNGKKIVFNGNASLVVDGASVSIDRCTLEKHDDEGATLLAKVMNGNISLFDCEISGFYREDGKLLDVVDSEVSFKDCGFTLQVNRIALCSEISGGTVNVSGCRFTSLGQSASALKIRNADCTFEGNLFTLIGGICKGVELTGGTAAFAGDLFNAQSDGKYRNSGAVFRNGGCKVTGLPSTINAGF